MPASLLANHFISRVPGGKTGNPEYVTRKEARLSLDSAEVEVAVRLQHLLQSFILIAGPSTGSHHVRPLLWLIIVKTARRSDNRFECPNLHSRVPKVPDVFDVHT